MSHTVVAIFDTMRHAENAIQELLRNGFNRSNIDTSNKDNNLDQQKHESGISNFFNSLFGVDESEKYKTVASKNGTVVTVHTMSKEEAERAATILDTNGAINVNERAAGYNQAGQDTAFADTSVQDTTIPVIEEQLEVGKRTVETGGARVRSRIIEKPVEENLRLREEHVTVERTPVDRPATEEELSNLGEKEIELTEHAEVPVTSKTAKVVEEVRVGKEVEERKQTVQDTVRSTEVNVENVNKDKEKDYYKKDELANK